MAGMFSYFLVNSSIKNTTRKSGVFVCPMSSVSAWSTAAAVHGTTARAIHESPVISAEIDDEVLDFSAVFSVDTEFLPFSGKGEGKKAVPSFDVPCPVLSFLMRTWKYTEPVSSKPRAFYVPLLYK